MNTLTERTVTIDGKEVTFKATARTPRLYRVIFGRDMMQDMAQLRESYTNKAKDGKELSGIDLTLFENLAYVMAKQADPEIPGSPDEWLDGFGIFSIYELMPTILELWQTTTATASQTKKK